MITVSSSLPEQLVDPSIPVDRRFNPDEARPPLAAERFVHSRQWKYPVWPRLVRRINLVHRVYARWLLSSAKHSSLTGHPRIAQRVAKILPSYEFGSLGAFSADGAPLDVQELRRIGFEELSVQLHKLAPLSQALAENMQQQLADALFVDNHRVPFQFRELVRGALPIAGIADAADASQLRDLDGNWSYDLGGSYGVNIFGSAFYKQCIRDGVDRAESLGLALGPYHPVVADNVARLCDISGMDEVSFHMSGTEAVMQAVRVARYHTGRSHIVRFAGAYHGWWDGVQAGPGNPRPPHEVYTLSEMSDATLRVLAVRDDIACVLVNPIQAMHPNGAPPTDTMLMSSDRRCTYDRAAYTAWLQNLREVCTARRIALVFDEVFLGFRLARGGVQEYFGVKADLVTYGKSVGGGLPVGVVAGKASLMRRFDALHPGNVCFARGTFNAHPYVMTCMNEFLRHVDSPAAQMQYRSLDDTWAQRAAEMNTRFRAEGLPLEVHNLASVWSVSFTVPSRYNWMLQFYLRAEGISLAWIGTGRLIFSHDFSDYDMSEVAARFVRAGKRMLQDGWWWVDATLTNKSIKRRILTEMLQAVRELTPLSVRTRGTPPRVSSGRSTRP
ncbi:MAG: aminotransferase class III-fold pyridoxal phosphate-dependent enzyme [Phycisphaerae bacterium]|nr:aminotransferase class III-fold pyridoxal phosphate-dependent enzyme [Gemmatimonadaceae bacterium]